VPEGEGLIGLMEPVGVVGGMPARRDLNKECEGQGAREECEEGLWESIERIWDERAAGLVEAEVLLLLRLLVNEEWFVVRLLLEEEAAVLEDEDEDDDDADTKDVVEDVATVTDSEGDTPVPPTASDVLAELILAVPPMTPVRAVPFTVPVGAVPLPPEGIVMFPEAVPFPFPPAPAPDPRLSLVGATPPSAPYAAAISTV